MKLRPGPGVKKAAAATLIAAAAWFLYRAVADNWAQVRGFDWEVRPVQLAASVAALSLVLAWGVWVWGRVLRGFEHPPVGFGTLLRIWFLSNLARYIPGTVFQFVTAAQLSRSAGLSAAVLLTSLLLHTGMSLLSALLVAAWTLTGPLFPALPALPLALLATALASLAVHPRVLGWAIGLIPRLLKREVLRWNGSWGHGLGLLALSVASWAMYGCAYALFLSSLGAASFRALPLLSGVNALSFVAGFLVFFAPAGAGVRELAMSRLLLPILPASVAALVAVAARLWTVAAELLGGVVVLALTRRGAPSPPAGAPAAES